MLSAEVEGGYSVEVAQEGKRIRFWREDTSTEGRGVEEASQPVPNAQCIVFQGVEAASIVTLIGRRCEQALP